MSAEAPRPDPSGARLRELHAARVRAELELADRACPGSDTVASRWQVFCDVALVKGLRGVAEESGGAALSGSDGTALDLALTALGYDPQATLRTLSRPEPGSDPERCARRLRQQIEAVDPEVVIALDGVAAQDVAAAFGLEGLSAGEPTRVLGRTLLAVDGFESSLVDERAKRAVWSQLKSIARPEPVEG